MYRSSFDKKIEGPLDKSHFMELVKKTKKNRAIESANKITQEINLEESHWEDHYVPMIEGRILRGDNKLTLNITDANNITYGELFKAFSIVFKKKGFAISELPRYGNLPRYLVEWGKFSSVARILGTSTRKVKVCLILISILVFVGSFFWWLVS